MVKNLLYDVEWPHAEDLQDLFECLKPTLDSVQFQVRKNGLRLAQIGKDQMTLAKLFLDPSYFHKYKSSIDDNADDDELTETLTSLPSDVIKTGLLNAAPHSTVRMWRYTPEGEDQGSEVHFSFKSIGDRDQTLSVVLQKEDHTTLSEQHLSTNYENEIHFVPNKWRKICENFQIIGAKQVMLNIRKQKGIFTIDNMAEKIVSRATELFNDPERAAEDRQENGQPKELGYMFKRLECDVFDQLVNASKLAFLRAPTKLASTTKVCLSGSVRPIMITHDLGNDGEYGQLHFFLTPIVL